MTMINDKFNAIRIVQNAEGKYGLQEIAADGSVVAESYRYRTVEMATRIAQAMSDENDRIDAYETAHKPPA